MSMLEMIAASYREAKENQRPARELYYGKVQQVQQFRDELRDVLILSLRKNGHTLREIGKTLGISRERVRQLLWRAEKDAKREDLGTANWIVRNDLFNERNEWNTSSE